VPLNKGPSDHEYRILPEEEQIKHLKSFLEKGNTEHATTITIPSIKKEKNTKGFVMHIRFDVKIRLKDVISHFIIYNLLCMPEKR